MEIIQHQRREAIFPGDTGPLGQWTEHVDARIDGHPVSIHTARSMGNHPFAPRPIPPLWGCVTPSMTDGSQMYYRVGHHVCDYVVEAYGADHESLRADLERLFRGWLAEMRPFIAAHPGSYWAGYLLPPTGQPS